MTDPRDRAKRPCRKCHRYLPSVNRFDGLCSSCGDEEDKKFDRERARDRARDHSKS